MVLLGSSLAFAAPQKETMCMVFIPKGGTCVQAPTQTHTVRNVFGCTL